MKEDENEEKKGEEDVIKALTWLAPPSSSTVPFVAGTTTDEDEAMELLAEPSSSAAPFAAGTNTDEDDDEMKEVMKLLYHLVLDEGRLKRNERIENEVKRHYQAMMLLGVQVTSTWMASCGSTSLEDPT